MTKILTNSQGKVYVTSGGKAIVSTKNITSLSVTPTTLSQTITAPSGTDGYSPVNVAAVTASIDQNIVAENIKKDVTILSVTGTYEGSGGGGRYKLLDRVKTDSNVEIGTVCGFVYDSNDIEYAVVCLDAKYRNSSKVWCSNANSTVTNLPLYNNQTILPATETATFNTQKILDFCTSKGYTSTACTHCRNQTFTIGGTTVRGQLPNVAELCQMMQMSKFINLKDTSLSSYPALTMCNNVDCWASNQNSTSNAWSIYANGRVTTYSKSNGRYTYPVLELPNS